MRIEIQVDEGVLVVHKGSQTSTLPFGSPEAFRILSAIWLRSAWEAKYTYTFTWMGLPIIQLPDDLLRIQEIIFSLKPDIIVETGVAHGGSLVFYASLLKAMGKSGEVIGIDVDIRPHNRTAIERHCLSSLITLLDGNSVDKNVLASVRKRIKPGQTVLVVLDSNHSKAHVLAELEAYSEFVSSESYIIATDGIMANVCGSPRAHPDWKWNNPQEAAKEFLERHSEFILKTPDFLFNESDIREPVTHWPGAWLKKSHSIGNPSPFKS